MYYLKKPQILLFAYMAYIKNQWFCKIICYFLIHTFNNHKLDGEIIMDIVKISIQKKDKIQRTPLGQGEKCKPSLCWELG